MDFNAMLDGDVGTAAQPSRLPPGTYTWEIESRRFDKSARKKTDFVEFTLKCIGHDEDVQTEDLPDNWNGKKMKEEFYITEDALFRLDDFLKMAGVPEGTGRRQGIEDAVGRYIKGQVTHRPYTRQNGEPGVAAEFSQWATAE